MEADEAMVWVAYAGVNGGCETFRCRAEHAFARQNKKTLPFFCWMSSYSLFSSLRNLLSASRMSHFL
jgi:hypothetical protein